MGGVRIIPILLAFALCACGVEERGMGDQEISIRARECEELGLRGQEIFSTFAPVRVLAVQCVPRRLGISDD